MAICVTILALGSLPGRAAAQDKAFTHPTLVGAPAGLEEVASLFKRTHIPVRLYELVAPDSAEVGEEVRFAAVANVDAAALPLRVQWDFGDGTVARSLHALHRYEVPGTYTVTFTAANDRGAVTRTLDVTVRPASGPTDDTEARNHDL